MNGFSSFILFYSILFLNIDKIEKYPKSFTFKRLSSNANSLSCEDISSVLMGLVCIWNSLPCVFIPPSLEKLRSGQIVFVVLYGINIFEENVEMSESNSDQVRDQAILEQENFYCNPNEGEVPTWINEKILLTLNPNIRLNY